MNMNRNFILEQSRRDNTREAQITPYKRSAVWGLLTLILLLASLSLSALSYSPCYTNNMANGDAAFKQGRYSEAKTYYATAKKCNGGNPSAAQQKINSCDAKIKAQQEAAERQKAEEAAAKKKAEEERLAEERRKAEEASWSVSHRACVYGSRELNKGETEKAIAFFEEALRSSENDDEKIDAYLMLGRAYQMVNNFPKSRSYALEILRLNPKCGKAYVLIGDLYAASDDLCKDIFPLSNSWAAADKYARAAAIDPTCAEEAMHKRSELKFPSRDEMFKKGIGVGSSYHVGCWIQENTTARY